MTDVRLVWTGDRIQFVGTTADGESLLVGGDVEGPGAKPSDLVHLEVPVTSVQDPDPPWTFRSIHPRFELTGTVDASKAAKAVEIAETRYCAVAATIRSVVELTHEVEIVPEA